MKAQRLTTIAQLRASLTLQDMKPQQLRQPDQIIASRFTPQWKNVGPTAAKDIRSSWSANLVAGFTIAGAEEMPAKACQVRWPAFRSPIIVAAGSGFAQVAQEFPNAWVQEVINGRAVIITAGRVEYRDIFDADQLHFLQWCNLAVPNDLNNNIWSFISLSLTSD